jgi:hypothetical protein
MPLGHEGKRKEKSMKLLTGIALLTAWLLVGLSSPGRADTITSHFKVKGDTAIAGFDAADPEDPCIRNSAFVVASDLMEKQKPGGKQ